MIEICGFMVQSDESKTTDLAVDLQNNTYACIGYDFSEESRTDFLLRICRKAFPDEIIDDANHGRRVTGSSVSYLECHILSECKWTKTTEVIEGIQESLDAFSMSSVDDDLCFLTYPISSRMTSDKILMAFSMDASSVFV